MHERPHDHHDQAHVEGAAHPREVLLRVEDVRGEADEDGSGEQQRLQHDHAVAGLVVARAHDAHRVRLAQREGGEQVHVDRVLVLVAHQRKEDADRHEERNVEDADAAQRVLARAVDKHEGAGAGDRQQQLDAEDAVHLADERRLDRARAVVHVVRDNHPAERRQTAGCCEPSLTVWPGRPRGAGRPYGLTVGLLALAGGS